MPPVAIELLPAITTGRYRGLTFAERRAAEVARASLERAFDLIERVPTLSRTVAYLVRSVHVLTATPCFDVSHSDPEVPFSIFVSVPGGDEAHGPTRLAEAIVHECMHLQLTFIERALPMVADMGYNLFSPWQECLRPVQGVLHGLYVFGVVDAFLEALEPNLEEDERRFVERRRGQIAGEIARVGEVARALTPKGRQLAVRALGRAFPLSRNA
jgi:HEXXH motif-containing protein